jgi:pimeloyl-ACP methyl ester carboxylesterase
MTLRKRLAVRFVRTKFALLSAISKTKAAEAAFQLFCTPQMRVQKELPAVFEKAEPMHFKFEGNTVRGYRWNHPSSKKLLILHGFESSVVNFERYIKPLIQEGFEVLAFDAPAHGRSTGKTVNVAQYKQMVHHIYNSYGPIQSFIAHSFGGLTVCLFLEEIQHDSQFKVVLIAPATETTTAADNFFQFVRLDQGIRKEFDQLITKIGGKPPSWYSVSRAAKNIKAKVLFVQDTDDEMTPFSDVVPIMEKKYPNFKFIITKGLGHRRIYRDAENAKAILQFLTEKKV